MIEGYICCLTEIGSTTPNAFFDGYTMTESLDGAKLYPSRADAKLATSQLHTTYVDRDIVYIPAKQTISLGTIGTVLPNDPTVVSDTAPTTVSTI